MFPINIS